MSSSTTVASAWCLSVWTVRTCWRCCKSSHGGSEAWPGRWPKCTFPCTLCRRLRIFLDLRRVLATRIDDAGLTPQLRGFALQVLDELPSGDRLCHGDYHPGNVLFAADRITVIDWAGAARGVPEADHARTLLLLRWADPLPGTPRISRGLISAGRAIFTHGYRHIYAGRSNVPLRQVNQWLVVHVAARLSEGIDVERPKLEGILDRARRQAAR
jgi:Phosphotransferase enzyme family